MRVVIVGAGKLGYTIAELLSVEQMEVIVIDREENQLIAVKNNLDVLTIVANGSSPSTLSDPDVNSADIFIAVTGIDEVNLVACILAKEQGIPHTVARVRDMQLINDSKNYLKKNFSIDLALNPEMIAAQEIYRILMTPAALNVDDFANGKIRLFEVKIDRRSKISNIPLKKIKLPSEILVGLIFRNHQMIIPHGDDLLKLHDSAYLIGFPEAIEKFSSNFIFQDSKKIERVMIIGAGRVTKSLVTMLLQNRINIKIIDKDRARCEYIAQILSGNNIAIQGDGTDIDLLIEEGIASTDVVVCLTEDDKLNLMIALLAKHLGAKKNGC